MFHIRLKWKWIQPKDQLAVIKRLLSQSDTCVIATDPGREGEHIARTILEYVDYRGKLLRLWVHDLTPETIRTGFQRFGRRREYDTLAAAAKVRAALISGWGLQQHDCFPLWQKKSRRKASPYQQVGFKHQRAFGLRSGNGHRAIRTQGLLYLEGQV